jgi:hypothetical protein
MTPIAALSYPGKQGGTVDATPSAVEEHCGEEMRIDHLVSKKVRKRGENDLLVAGLLLTSY